MSTAVFQVELTEPLSDHIGLGNYRRARVLLRCRGHVVGQVELPVRRGALSGTAIRAAADELPWVRDRIAQVLVEDRLLPGATALTEMSWTVVVCTKDREENLKKCLDALVAAADGRGEIIVVDNGSATDATKELCARYPVRYAREDRPGLNRARALGAELATGAIVAYTDDDVIVDPSWLPGLLAPFAGSRVGAVTGLTMPYEIENEAQELFELYGGFIRGFERRVYDLTNFAPAGASSTGAGANMAFRRDLIVGMGLFDAELDMGTPSLTGGDAYALYRILAAGYRVIYTPDAVNWHRHRKDRESLRRTLYGYGVGLYAFLMRAVVEHHDLQALRVGMAWFREHHVRKLFEALTLRPNHLPLDLVWAEIRGTFKAPIAYWRCRRLERAHRRSEAVVPTDERMSA